MLLVQHLESSLPPAQEKMLAIKLKGKLNAHAEAKALLQQAVANGPVKVTATLDANGNIVAVELAGSLSNTAKAKLITLLKAMHIGGLRTNSHISVTFQIAA